MSTEDTEGISMLVRVLAAFCLACCWLSALCPAALGQEQESEPFSDFVQANKRLFQARDWDSLLANMTDAGRLEFKRQTIATTFLWLAGDSKLPIADVDEMREALKSVFESQGVTKLEVPSFDVPLGFDLEWHQEFRRKTDHAADEILRQSMNHKGLMTDLCEVLMNTRIPQFGEVILVATKVKSATIDGDTAEVVLQFEPSLLPRDDDVPKLDFQLSVALYVVKFSKVDNEWKFNGLDIERTWEERNK